MNRIGLALLLLIALGAVIVVTVRFESDVRILGLSDTGISALNSPAGRQLSIAVVDADPNARSETAKSIGSLLNGHRLIETVSLGPPVFDNATAEWFWTNRFRLAPPPDSAFTAEALQRELEHARQSLLSGSGLMLGDKFLRDPTGSFRRLVERARSGDRLPSHDGVWQSLTSDAALIFAVYKPLPFDHAAQHDLRAEIEERFRLTASKNAELLVLGPRVITAEVNQDIGTGSTWTAGWSVIVIMIWLIWIARSFSVMLRLLIPLLAGLGCAVLAVQFVYGSVHLIALGFGGALLGLAIDYPLHFLSHDKAEEKRTRQLVLLGAMTTAIAFGALTGADLPGLSQIGVFVATGLLASGLTALWLCADRTHERLLTLPAECLLWTLPGKRIVLVAATVMATLGLTQIDALRPDAGQIISLPPQTLKDIRSFRKMARAPDERYLIHLSAPSLERLLVSSETATAALREVSQQNALGSWVAFSDYVPSRQRQTSQPDPDRFQRLVSDGLDRSGLNNAYLPELMASYRAAFEAPPLQPGSLLEMAALRPIHNLLIEHDDRFETYILLNGIEDAAAIQAAISDLDDPTTRFIDHKGQVSARLDVYRQAAVTWFLIGTVLALGCLALLAPGQVAVVNLGLTLAAAISVTAFANAALDGGLGIFQILALTLIAGIGIDYGLFLEMARSAKQRKTATRSVALCAITTLAAFTIMAVSPIQMLSEIGRTVTIGVILLVCFGFAMPPEKRGEKPSANEQPGAS